MVDLLHKIEVWWIVNLEIPLNQDFDGSEEIDESKIMPGSVMMLKVTLDVASGDPEKASYYLDEFRKPNSKHE